MVVGNKMPVQTFGRILYVEPNDVSGAINGVPLTPDYTDMCISFNLICEVKSRLNNDVPYGETTVKTKDKKSGRARSAIYQIFGVTGEGETKSWISFLQGENYGKGINSLSTYYVDINYDDYLKNNIVEGLGVENITISHETYYTPTVTIKFVDHRGSSLFGREEATHYNDKLTIDNIFGAFFTAPYPEYYLTVKGFYGRPITYRLCCSNFKGSLNSQTGNFEAIATFIGYSYSILTDIPFEYLVAAPYCEYVGKDYWKSKCTSKEWQMEGSIDNEPVPTLFQLFQRINAAFTKEELLQVITNEEKEIVDNGKLEKDTLTSIKSIYESYVSCLKSRSINNFDDGEKYQITERDGDGEITYPYEYENEQLLLMKQDNSDNIWNSAEEVWNSLNNTISEYNKTYADNTLTEDKLPSKLPFQQMDFTDYFLINDNNVVLKDVSEITVESIKKTKINGVEPSEIMARKILNMTQDKNEISKLRKYVYLVDLGTLSTELEKRIEVLSTTIDEINRKRERNYVYLAIEYLGIVPYMGNIFKLIMCHIETFIHMMHQCFINIDIAKELGQRSPAYLGVNIRNTDFITNDSKNIFLPPWPSVNRKDTNDTEYSEIERDVTYGWVGDFSDYFEEVKLVRALYLACERTSGDPAKEQEETIEFLYAPILPNDLNNSLNPFNNSELRNGEHTISSMAGMLGIRTAQIFGVAENSTVEDDIARTFGQVDALNFYRYLGSKYSLRQLLEQCDGNLAEDLYDIMLCKQSADNYGYSEEGSDTNIHDFEFAKGLYNDIPRHPIFKEVLNGGKQTLNYTYMPTKSRFGIIPSNTYDNQYYRNRFVGNPEGNSYFAYDYLSDKTFIHYCTASQLFKDYKNEDEKTKYVNEEMYDIVTKSQHVAEIIKRYDEMKSGKVSVLSETFEVDTKKLLDRYWRLDKSNCYQYLKDSHKVMTKPYKDYGIEEKMLLGSKFDNSISVRDTYDNKFAKMDYAYFTDNQIKIGDSEVNQSDLVMPEINCWFGKIDGNDVWRSLFGIDFYYMQNQITDTEVRTRVKALLFLHSLFYNNEISMSWDSGNVGHALITRIPFGLVALYGGLLWRHNYIMTHNYQDPIQYEDYYKSAGYRTNEKTEYTLFGISPDGKWRMSLRHKDDNYNYYYSVFPSSTATRSVFKHVPDYMVTNKLISIFEQFVNGQWKVISNLELHLKDGIEFKNGKVFRDYILNFWNLTRNSLKTIQTQINEEKKSQEEQQNVEIDFTDVASDAYRDIYNTAIKTLADSFQSFEAYYSFLWYYLGGSNDKLKLWFNTDNKEVQDALRTTFLGECIELRTMSGSLGLTDESKLSEYSDISVSIPNIKSYLDGFVGQLNIIVGNSNNNTGISVSQQKVIDDTPDFNRETALPIYMYLKALWDKWLVAMDLEDHEFTVKKFNDNFIFIDSFYRNITHRFMCNCQLLLDCYNNNTSSNKDISVFKFIGDITTKHNCLFIAVPDFIDSWTYERDTEIRTSMETIFVPMPYNSMGKMRLNNKFVVMYIPKLSETPSEMNNFRSDGFNIWSYNDPMVERGDSTVRTKNNTLPNILNCSSEVVLEAINNGIDYSNYSYYVPAFGLAYGRQNNHIFKDMKLSMDAPSMTSTMINTLSNAARLGASNTHRIAFIGQDIYPVFSNYAYMCEFEMMGCAQIMPLMYFQLMNVPMWRGTYLIYSVSHTMTPGNMVTRVKAVKMSNKAVPYSNAWYTENPYFDINEWRKLQCMEEFAQGINYDLKTINSSNDTADGNISGDDVPVLIGDSWANAMKAYFSGNSTAVDGCMIVKNTGGVKSAVTQIKDYLKQNPSPKFILCYCGRNNPPQTLTKCVEEYTELVDACNGRTIYFIQEQYDCHYYACQHGDKNSRTVIDRLNTAMLNICNTHNNAKFVDLNSNGFNTVDVNGNSVHMRCCVNQGCGCSNDTNGTFHLKASSYKLMLETVLKVIGHTEYFKG